MLGGHRRVENTLAQAGALRTGESATKQLGASRRTVLGFGPQDYAEKLDGLVDGAVVMAAGWDVQWGFHEQCIGVADRILEMFDHMDRMQTTN